MSLCVHVGIQVGGLFANGPRNCFLNHMLIPWVSEVIYYCDYFEFGIICMLLTSFFTHFVFSALNWSAKSKVPRIRELWYVAYMLAYASVLHLTICRITWSLWRGT